MTIEAPFIRTPGSSELLSSLGELMTIEVSLEDCGNRFALVEQLASGGLATRLHAQLTADETGASRRRDQGTSCTCLVAPRITAPPPDTSENALSRTVVPVYSHTRSALRARGDEFS